MADGPYGPYVPQTADTRAKWDKTWDNAGGGHWPVGRLQVPSISEQPRMFGVGKRTEMETEVARVAARLRGVYAEKLFEWTGNDEKNDEGRRYSRKARVFAPFVARKRGLNAVSSPLAVDSKALLYAVFRRFAGELMVQGKLLNQDELLVYRLTRKPAQQRHQTASSDGVVVVLPTDGTRFIVRCDDAPATRIGSIVSATVASTHARALSASPVVLYRDDEAVAAVWEDKAEQDLVTMTSVFGFDVAGFRACSGHRRRPCGSDSGGHSGGEEQDEDDERDCANATIVGDWTFSDLRCVSRMMEANGLGTKQWVTMATADKARGVVDEQVDVWSYVSLGNVQKRMWSQERATRGDALRAKARLKEALVEYGSAIRLDDTNVGVLVKRGQAFLELRQFEDAIRDFESVQQIDPTHEEGVRGLLRAKGKLGHSKHVAKTVSTRRSRSRSRERSRDVREKDSRPDPPVEPVAGIQILEDAYALEKDRLRQLLEEEARLQKLSRKAHRRRDRSLDSSDTTDSDAESRRSGWKSSKSHKRSKKSKKSDRKKHRKSSRTRDDDREERRRTRSRSAVSSASSSNDSAHSSRHRKRRAHSRSRSRTRSRSHYKD